MPGTSGAAPQISDINGIGNKIIEINGSLTEEQLKTKRNLIALIAMRTTGVLSDTEKGDLNRLFKSFQREVTPKD